MKKQTKNLKIGLISKFYPENDSIARVYCNPLLDIAKEHKDIEIIKIGTENSDADYKIDLKSLFLYKSIRAIIKKEKLDLLHIQYIAPFYSKYLLNMNLWPVYNLKIPIITTMHEVHYPDRNGEYSMKQKILNLTQKAIIKRSRKVIVHAPYQRSFLEKKYKRYNIVNIYTGLDLKKTLDRSKKNLIFFGMYRENKGISKLIRAMKSLKDYRLVIAGSIPDNYAKECYLRFHSLIKRLRLKNTRIIAKRWVSDKEKDRLFKRSSIVAIPYSWGPYNSGLVQDAAEYGLPHAVTKTGAIWEVTHKFKMGEIMPSNSPKDIIEAVKKITKDYNKYSKGIESYRKAASWKIFKERYYKIYKDEDRHNN